MRWQWRPAAEVAERIARALVGDHGARAPAERAYPLASFQEEAVRRARGALARRGGVIIADDVGLGKTYVALALIEEAVRAGERVVVVVPAALRRTWQPLLRRLCPTGAAVHLTTHTRLSRGTHDVARLREARLVVVDEAHAFRNPATRRYRALADRGAARLVLLTATPVNNSPADLLHLVRQFAADDAFRDVGVASLAAALAGPGGGVAGVLASGAVAVEAAEMDAARIARAVIIRRTREHVGGAGFLPGAAAAGGAAPRSAVPLRFPRRAPTAVVRYDDPHVPALVRGIAGLELAPYRVVPSAGLAAPPAPPNPATAGGGIDALLRLNLLKRLESGRTALAASLHRLRALLLAFADAADAGRLLAPSALTPGARGDDDDPAAQLELHEILHDRAPPSADLRRLAASARRDAEMVAALLDLAAPPDPKVEALLAWAARLRGGEDKAVIFTEFRATAAALWRALAPGGRVGRVDGSGAWLGTRRSGRDAVIRRFAPVSSGAPQPPPRERVDVLVATDVLGEGLNLQDAAVVVSYDLPWNPVRLLQRIGRVDRLGAIRDVVQPVVFVPGTGLDDVLRLTRRLRDKLGGIARTVGAGEAGDLLSAFGGGAGDLRALRSGAHGIRALAGSPADPWEPLRARLRFGEKPESRRHPSELPILGRVPDAHVRTPDGPGPGGATGGTTASAWVLLVEGPGAPAALLVRQRGGIEESPREVADILERVLAAGDSVCGCVGEDRNASRTAAEREASLAAGRAVAWLRARARAAAVAPPLLDGGAARVLSAHLRDDLIALGAGPHPGLVARADAVLRRLAAPHPASLRIALEAVAAQVLGSTGPTPAARLDRVLSALELLLQESSRASTGRSSPGALAWRVVAALRVPFPAPENDAGGG